MRFHADDDDRSAYISGAKSHAIHDQGYAVSQDGEDDGTMFWETTVFWHWGGGCFGIDDKEKYDAAWEEEIGSIDDRGTDDDISSEPPTPPEPGDEGESGGDGTGVDAGTDASFTVTTTRIRGQRFGRLSWRELMIDE